MSNSTEIRIASLKGRQGRKGGRELGNESTGLCFRHTVCDPFNAILQMNRAEINQEPQASIAQAKLLQTSKASRARCSPEVKTITSKPLRPSRPLREASVPGNEGLAVTVISRATETVFSRKGRKGRKVGGELGNESAGLCIRQTVCDPFNAILKMDLAEIYQESKASIAQAKLCEQLLPVNRKQLFQGFEFHNQLVFNQQIGSKAFVEQKLVVTDRNCNLPLNSQVQLAKLMGEGGFINRLKEPRTRFGVDLESGVQNQFRKFIFRERSWVSHRPKSCRVSKLQSSKASAITSKPLRPSRRLREASVLGAENLAAAVHSRTTETDFSRKGREGRKVEQEPCDELIRPDFRYAVCDPFNAIHQMNLAEIHQKLKASIAQAKLFQSSRASRVRCTPDPKGITSKPLRPSRPLREAFVPDDENVAGAGLSTPLREA